MELNNSQFKEIIENIPLIEVFLNWTYTEGGRSFVDHEIIIGSFVVYSSFDCYETLSSNSGDFCTPPTYDSNGLESVVTHLNVYNDDGDEIKISTEQKEALIKKIESSIISI